VRNRGEEDSGELGVGDEKSVGDEDEDVEGDGDEEMHTEVGDDTAAMEGSHQDAILA
jgi:hypothetical protein